VSKYGNIKTAGYHSKKEAARAQSLKLMEKAGNISELREQVPFELAPSVIINGRKSAARKYIADFVYTEDGKQVVEDVKGMKTDIYVLKRHLMKHVHGIDIYET